jgi:ABC-type glycerol-3-phosphate transport system substrate-binding protein
MKYKFKKLVLIFLLAVVLAACANSSDTTPNSPTQAATATNPSAAQLETPTSQGSQFESILIWVPPDFDPAAETETGALLADRLQTFTNEHPGVRIETRIKAVEGDAGLYKTLQAASASAPLTLPDLIILSTEDMRTAAENSLIRPLDEYAPELFDDNWYEFAQSLATYDGQTFGLPFAVDALVMTYRPLIIGNPPDTWQKALETSGLISFPAASPDAMVTIAMYLSLMDSLRDENNNLALNQAALEAVFTFFRSAQTSGLIPYWLVQYQDDESSWSLFQERQTQMCITWSRRYLQDQSGLFNAAPIPTRSGSPFTLAQSWNLSITNATPSKTATAVELAKFLSQAEFLGSLTEASGYMPPRVDSLVVWQEGAKQALASQILPQAISIPLPSDLDKVSELLSSATVGVLKLEIDPEKAVEEIMAALSPQ